jgi:hypothetical protein
MREGGFYSQLKKPDKDKELHVTVSAADPDIFTLKRG